MNGETIKNKCDINAAVQRAHNSKQTNTTIEFKSLVGIVMSSEGVPPLQVDQLNIIAHHLNKINAKLISGQIKRNGHNYWIHQILYQHN